METEQTIQQISLLKSVGSCFTLSFIYVASLYIWKSEHNRDHPTTIKKRFLSVFAVVLISPIFVYLFSSNSLYEKATIWKAMGFRMEGFILALIIPLLLTIILFLGPLSIQVYNGVWKLYIEPMYWITSFQNILWLRNHLVAPFTEEFTFRACMLPLLLQYFRPMPAVLITPLFFGVAHFHHMIERLQTGMDMKTAIIISCFQFAYTSIFGIYSAYLFTTTGHFIAPFIAHAFCNHMGFPDFQEVFSQPDHKKTLFLALYVIGLLSWIILLPIVTIPEWYSNTLYWHKS